MTEYTAGTCEYCSGTGLRDAETLCPTCDGSGGRLPITAESVDAALEAVGLSEFEAAAGAAAPTRSRRSAETATGGI